VSSFHERKGNTLWERLPRANRKLCLGDEKQTCRRQKIVRTPPTKEIRMFTIIF